MHRPGVELAISRSQVRRPNHYTSQPPVDTFKSACYSHVSLIRGTLSYSHWVLVAEYGSEQILWSGQVCCKPNTSLNRGGSSPKILGALLPPPQLLHHRVHFLRSPKPKIRTLYRPTFEIYHYGYQFCNGLTPETCRNEARRA